MPEILKAELDCALDPSDPDSHDARKYLINRIYGLPNQPISGLPGLQDNRRYIINVLGNDATRELAMSLQRAIEAGDGLQAAQDGQGEVCEACPRLGPGVEEGEFTTPDNTEPVAETEE